MRRAILLFAVLALCLPMVGEGQSIQYKGAGGLTELTSSGTAITSTVPLRVPDGSASAPGLAAASDTDTGIYFAGEVMNFGSSAAQVFGIRGSSKSLELNTAAVLSWLTTGTRDLVLLRDAAATLQLGADAATATAQTIKGSDSTGSGTAGGSLTLKGGAGTSGNANGGQLILQGGANAGSGEPGAVAIADGGTKPTCAAGIRGSIWYDAGGAGVADTFEVCRKDAGDTYAWVALF